MKAKKVYYWNRKTGARISPDELKNRLAILSYDAAREDAPLWVRCREV